MFDLKTIFIRFISLILGLSSPQSFPPPLSHAEEAELFAKMRDGDGSSRAKLIEHNMRLVSHINAKFLLAFQQDSQGVLFLLLQP